MKHVSFLWRYFRRRLGWAFLAVVATLVFSTSTVFLLALFRPILSEVVRVDDASASIFPSSGGEGASREDSADSGGLSQGLDLEAAFESAYEYLASLLGIDDENVIYFLPILFVAVFLLRSLSGFVNGYLFQVIGLGATNDLRNDLYEGILHQSSRFYSEHPSGELVSRVGNDISVMQNAVSNRLLDLFQQSVTLVGLIWFLLSTHLQMALICLLVVPAVFYPVVRFGKGMRTTSRWSQERLADLSNLVAEAVRGHRVVKAFGMERFELDRFREASHRHLKVRLKSQLLAYGSGPVVEFLAALGAAAFLIYTGRAIRAGELTPSETFTFLTTLVMLYDPIRKLNKVNLILQEAMAAVQRVAGLMAIPNAVVDSPQGRQKTSVESEICFEKVSFAYDRDAVLKSLDITIQAGEVVALVGPSGAGKSTLVNLLPRFFDPDSGRVTIDGVDVRDLTLASLRSLIGIVTQETMLFNDSIRNNIAYGRSDLPLEGVRQAAKAAYADDFVRELPRGYETVIGESGANLSGGQRQRLAIARALLKNPPILILDEATSHLDSESESLVQKALYNLMDGRTALVIAHRLSTVKRADRILVLEEGRVVEEGSHDELISAGGVYGRLYDLQFRDD